MSDPHPTTSPAIGLAIGEVSQQTGIPIETLRFYDRSGLLGDLPRTAGGHRVFDELSLGLLDVVIRLRRTGMPVEDVRAFVDGPAPTATAPAGSRCCAGIGSGSRRSSASCSPISR